MNVAGTVTKENGNAKTSRLSCSNLTLLSVSAGWLLCYCPATAHCPSTPLLRRYVVLQNEMQVQFLVACSPSYGHVPHVVVVDGRRVNGSQMGSSYKKAVLSKHVERVLRQWHKDAKQRLKVSAASAAETSDDSSSSSLILHFKSKISHGQSLQRRDSHRSQIGNSVGLSSAQVRNMEEGSLNR